MHTVVYFHSQDVIIAPGMATIVLPTWSVYVEAENIKTGKTVEGSQQWVSRHDTEIDARGAAWRLQQRIERSS